MKDQSSKEILEALEKNEALRREVIHELARTYPREFVDHLARVGPREFLSRVKIDPSRVKDALGGVVVSCKEWQE